MMVCMRNTCLRLHPDLQGDDAVQAKRHYVPLRQYCDSKLAIVMAVQSLQRRFDRFSQ